MKVTRIRRSYDLTNEEIDKQVTETSAGNYHLGHIEDGRFRVRYVGRSDTDLNGRLKKWVAKYERFRFQYASSPKAAFGQECQDFHSLGESTELDNEIHPQRPANASWKCPVCDIFG
jgi:hypothetical protein